MSFAYLRSDTVATYRERLPKAPGEDSLIPAALHWLKVLSRPVLRNDSGQLS